MSINDNQFAEYIETISTELSKLTEEEEMNILFNLIKNVQERRNIYPGIIMIGVNNILNGEMSIWLSPGSEARN